MTPARCFSPFSRCVRFPLHSLDRIWETVVAPLERFVAEATFAIHYLLMTVCTSITCTKRDGKTPLHALKQRPQNSRQVFVAADSTEWLRHWYTRSEAFQHCVESKSTDSPQSLLMVNATKLVDHLLVSILVLRIQTVHVVSDLIFQNLVCRRRDIKALHWNDETGIRCFESHRENDESLALIRSRTRTTWQELPAQCLRDLRQMGPCMMKDAAVRLSAVLRRCNAVLSGSVRGVDAMGEKVGANMWPS